MSRADCMLGRRKGGGTPSPNRTRSKSTTHRKPHFPFGPLRELQRDALFARDSIVFVESAFAPLIPALLSEMDKRKRKTEEQQKRSAFSYVLGQVETIALEAACVVLEKHGFRPTSLLFDGCLTTHNPNGSMSAAIEEAKEAVERAVGFPGMVLKEKGMFGLAAFSIAEHACKEDATRAAEAAVVESEGEDADSDA